MLKELICMDNVDLKQKLLTFIETQIGPTSIEYLVVVFEKNDNNVGRAIRELALDGELEITVDWCVRIPLVRIKT